MKTPRFLASALAFAVAASAAPAVAHPQLVSSSLAQSSSPSHVYDIVLRFNEPLVPAFSGFGLVMIATPGPSHGHEHEPISVSGVKVAVGPDGKSLVGTLARKLPSGSYELNWRAAGSDTHRVTGKISFTVQ